MRLRRTGAQGQQVAPQSVPENLHLSLAQMRTALNSLPMGVIIVDADGSEWWRNRAAHDLLDAASVSGGVSESLEYLFRRVVRSKSERTDITVEGPPYRTVEARTVPLVNGGGLIVLEDITERFLTDRVRTDFVSNISHELKTPVGAMSLLAETIMGEIEGIEAVSDVAPLARRIVEESRRVSRTINDLLELASIEFGGAANSGPVRMQAVVAEAIARVQPFADAKRITVARVIPEEDINVTGDTVQLVSVVANLVENAVKYSDTGTEVVVSLEEDAPWARLSVSDSGIGISPDHLDRVFERFYRVDPARSRETGGTGLGLSIVRHIVSNHGGEVGLVSEEGKGSTFTVLLPLRKG